MSNKICKKVDKEKKKLERYVVGILLPGDRPATKYVYTCYRERQILRHVVGKIAVEVPTGHESGQKTMKI